MDYRLPARTDLSNGAGFVGEIGITGIGLKIERTEASNASATAGFTGMMPKNILIFFYLQAFAADFFTRGLNKFFLNNF